MNIKFPYTKPEDIWFSEKNKVWDIAVSTGPLSKVTKNSIGYLWPTTELVKQYGDVAQVIVLVGLSKPTILKENERLKWPTGDNYDPSINDTKKVKHVRYTFERCIKLSLADAKVLLSEVAKVQNNSTGVYVK